MISISFHFFPSYLYLLHKYSQKDDEQAFQWVLLVYEESEVPLNPYNKGGEKKSNHLMQIIDKNFISL